MTTYIKGLYSYIRPGSDNQGGDNDSTASSSSSSNSKDKPEAQQGYLKMAVTGIASGVYTVGSGTVSAGVNGVKWVAGTTYDVTSSVVCGAGTVATAVGTGASTAASTVVAKVKSGKGKEHKD